MFESILLSTKFSPRAGAAREVALELTRSFGAKLHVLTVYDCASLERDDFDLATIPDDVKRNVVHTLDAKLDEYLEPFASLGILPERIIRFGNPEKVISKTATEVKANLIIIGSGTRKAMLFERFLRNVADKVRKRATCHVLTVV